MEGDKRESHTSRNDRRQTAQEPIRTIAIRRIVQFAAQLTDPPQRFWWPGLGNDKNNLGGQQDHGKQAPHPLNGVNA